MRTGTATSSIMFRKKISSAKRFIEPRVDCSSTVQTGWDKKTSNHDAKLYLGTGVAVEMTPRPTAGRRSTVETSLGEGLSGKARSAQGMRELRDDEIADCCSSIWAIRTRILNAVESSNQKREDGLCPTRMHEVAASITIWASYARQIHTSLCTAHTMRSQHSQRRMHGKPRITKTWFDQLGYKV